VRRRPRPRLRWLLIGALIVLPLIAGEIGIRTLITAGRLPVAAAPAGEEIWAYQADWPVLDVAIVGDSISHSGIDPAVLGDLLEEHTGEPFAVYDLAVPGHGPGTSLAMLRELERQGRLPRLVILGLSAVTLRADNPGDRLFLRSPMGELFEDCEGVEGIARIVDCRVSQVSALWRWRGRPVAIWKGVRGTYLRHGVGGRNLRRDGFAEGPSRSVAHLRGQIEKGLKGEPVEMALAPGVAADYRELVAFLREHGSDALGVLIPYSPVYAEALEARWPGWDLARLDAARALSEAIDAPIIDPGQLGSWWGDGMSQNIKHLSGPGAEAFTRQVWQADGFRDAVTDALGTQGPVAPSSTAPWAPGVQRVGATSRTALARPSGLTRARLTP